MSSGEIERRVLEGRVFTGGVAQETTREGNVTRVRLTVMPDHPAVAYAGLGGITTIPFPEPVTVGSGETIVVEVEGLANGGQVAAYLRSPATFTDAHLYSEGPRRLP